MTKWDYKTVVLTGGFIGRHKEEFNRPALEKQFDDLGADGWELCWIPAVRSPAFGYATRR